MANLIQIKKSLNFVGSEADAIAKIKGMGVQKGEPLVITYTDTDTKIKSLYVIGSDDLYNPFIFYDVEKFNDIINNITPNDIGTYTKAEIDAKDSVKVDKTTTVNGYPLSNNVNINAGDVNAYNKTEVDIKLTNYLPLAGGTMTGNIIFGSGGSPTKMIYANGDASFGSITSNSSVNASSFIKSGGTNQQVLLADGTVTTLSDLRASIQLTNENINSYTPQNNKEGYFYAAEGNTVTPIPPSFVYSSGSQTGVTMGFSLQVVRMGGSFSTQIIFGRLQNSENYQKYYRTSDGVGGWTQWYVQTP